MAEIKAVNFAIEPVQDPLGNRTSLPATFFVEHGHFGFVTHTGQIQLELVLIVVAPKLKLRQQTALGDFAFARWHANVENAMRFIGLIDIVTRTHVEGHSAALMQKQSISEGVLYINNPAICTNCTRNLPYMLGSGRSLEVVPFNGTGVPFTGVLR